MCCGKKPVSRKRVTRSGYKMGKKIVQKEEKNSSNPPTLPPYGVHLPQDTVK